MVLHVAVSMLLHAANLSAFLLVCVFFHSSSLVLVRFDELGEGSLGAVTAIVECRLIKGAVRAHHNNGVLLGAERTQRPRLRHTELREAPLRAEVLRQQRLHPW